MDKSSVVLDSNILFAYYAEEDALHSKSLEIIDLIEATGSHIYIHYGVILEVSTLIARKYSKADADRFVRDCLDAANVTLISGEAREDAMRFISHTDRMAWVDHILIHIATEYDAMLLTFDGQLMKRYASGW